MGGVRVRASLCLQARTYVLAPSTSMPAGRVGTMRHVCVHPLGHTRRCQSQMFQSYISTYLGSPHRSGTRTETELQLMLIKWSNLVINLIKNVENKDNTAILDQIDYTIRQFTPREHAYKVQIPSSFRSRAALDTCEAPPPLRIRSSNHKQQLSLLLERHPAQALFQKFNVRVQFVLLGLNFDQSKGPTKLDRACAYRQRLRQAPRVFLDSKAD